MLTPATVTATARSPAVRRLSLTVVSQTGLRAAAHARSPLAVPTAAVAVTMH
jgi:hypothetical protein